MAEAMKQIRTELGEDAVILNSKMIQNVGFLGLFKRKKIEVIAAIDTQSKNNPVTLKEKKPAAPPKQPVIHDNSQNSTTDDLHDELAELKKMVQDITKTKLNHNQSYPDIIQQFSENLNQQDIQTDINISICDQLLEKWRTSKIEPTAQVISDWGKEILINQISSFQHGGISEKRKFVNLVGPTGVGKTTTLAKIAAGQLLENKKKIAFITTDTYRIAAIEQLKTYANLLNVPVEVVYKLPDFQKAIDKFVDFDLVFIDTAGRNYRDYKYIEELKKLIDFDQDIETYLALSVTMKEKDVSDIVKNFESINIDKFIFTKLDETTTYGSLINLMLKYKKGVAYLTNGQDVPDDIKEGSAKVMVHQLFERIIK